MKQPKLFTPLEIGNLTLPNRIVVSPMCQYSSIDGCATDWHLMHYGQFAAGKAGMIVQEATAVASEGRITYADMGLWNDAQAEKLRSVVDFVHQQNGLIGIQLAHAGRKASTNIPWINRKQFAPNEDKGWQTISSSPIGFHHKDVPPHEMTKEDIQRVMEDFKQSAKRAIAVGYDMIEIHAAHGYLFHQFLSPLINQRTDEYGGSIENRIRLLIEVTDTLRNLNKDISLWVRISATDWAPNGWDLQQSIALCKELKKRGVDAIDVSTGGAVHHQEIPVEEGYQVPFAEQIKQETSMCTGTVGMIPNAHFAETILQNQQADFISVGRGFLQNPHLVYEWAKELQVDCEWQPQYERGKETL